MNNEEDQNTFSKFTNDIYIGLLHDYQHLINKHADDLAEIHETICKYDFAKCTAAANKCAVIMNHYDRKHKTTKDSVFNFYQDIYNNLHFYLIHLYETALRFNKENIVHVVTAGREDKYDCYDEQFADIKTSVDKSKNELQNLKLGLIKRYSGDKFNMHSANVIEYSQIVVDNKKGATFLTALFDHFVLYTGRISSSTISTFHDILFVDEYDTDALIDDIYDHEDADIVGNIESHLNDKMCSNVIKQFIANSKSSSSSFKIGFLLFYWPYYKNQMEKKDDNINIDNIDDYSQYYGAELYVEKKYKTIKDEIINSRYITMKNYTNLIMTKCNKWKNQQIVQEIKAPHDVDYLHYDIPYGTIISLTHLIAIICYTDFSKFCTHFSSTFRAIQPFEALASIKKRNSIYWHVSKALREVVQVFGDNRLTGGFNKGIKGPFFSGINKIMCIPQFSIRLFAPTSTSRQIAIATRFGGDNGMIIALNNNGDHFSAMRLRGFNCSWISDYPEEDEIVFCGGDWRIRIQTIRHIKTAKNYFLFVKPLFYLDAMINGAEMFYLADKNELTKREIKLLKQLINNESGIQIKKDFERYVIDLVHLFCISKKQIILNLFYLDEYFKHIYGFLVESIKKDKCDIDGNIIQLGKGNIKNNNLVKKSIFTLFPNVTTIIIYCSDPSGEDYSYSFSLLSLISLVGSTQNRNNINIIIKSTHNNKRQDGRSWLYQEYNKLESKYGWKISLSITQHTNNFGKKRSEDCVTIIAPNYHFKMIDTIQ